MDEGELYYVIVTQTFDKMQLHVPMAFPENIPYGLRDALKMRVVFTVYLCLARDLCYVASSMSNVSVFCKANIYVS